MTEAATAQTRASGFADNPDYRVDFEPTAKRVRALFNGVAVVDTTAARLMLETAHTPVYYFPRADVRLDLLRRTERRSFCPYKGEASYWTLAAGARAAENAAWSYESPFDEVAAIKDYIAFYWDAIDGWYEEDDPIFAHPRDPHVRIDVLNSARPVRVVLAGETLAETRRGRFLFETALATRHYIPRDDVRMDLLEPSETHTLCPYKGEAAYFSARIGERRVRDVGWCYPAPLAEAQAIEGYVCFYPERVDALTVDGAPVA